MHGPATARADRPPVLSPDRSSDVLARRRLHAARADHELAAELPVVLRLYFVMDRPPCLGIWAQSAEHSFPLLIGITCRGCALRDAPLRDMRTVRILAKTIPRDGATFLRWSACARDQRCAKSEQDEDVSNHAMGLRCLYDAQNPRETRAPRQFDGTQGKTNLPAWPNVSRTFALLCGRSEAASRNQLHRTTIGAILGCNLHARIAIGDS